MTGPVRLTIEKGAAILTLANPAGGNRLGLEACRALDAAAERLSAAAQVRALLIRSEGRQFSVGGAIEEFASRAGISDYLAEILPIGHRALFRLATLDFPVISAVQGPVAGAGIALALCADLVFVGGSAALRAGYPALGLSSDFGVSLFLERFAGPRVATELLLTNRLLSAEEMVVLGLATCLCTDEALEAESRAMLGRLANGPTASLGRLKRLTGGVAHNRLLAQLRDEERFMLECGRTEDANEGVTAFLARRAPTFHGR